MAQENRKNKGNKEATAVQDVLVKFNSSFEIISTGYDNDNDQSLKDREQGKKSTEWTAIQT